MSGDLMRSVLCLIAFFAIVAVMYQVFNRLGAF